MSENNDTTGAEAMNPDVEDAPLPHRPILPYRRNPTLECDMCWAPPLRECDPYCIARLSAAEQIAHRDAVLDRTLAELGIVEGAPWAKRSDPEFVDLDPEDYTVTSCTVAGRHRARVDMWPRYRRLRAVLIVAVVVLVMALAALWASQQAHAETFDVCPSCAFADNVRRAFYWEPGWTVIATSPVTGKFYTMQCVRTLTDNLWLDPKRCYGVNDSGAVLVVYIA